MTAITVRNLPEETHRALKLRAARHGRSTEAEIREILRNAVRPRIGLGSALRAVGLELGGLEFVLERDQTLPEPADFGRSFSIPTSSRSR